MMEESGSISCTVVVAAVGGDFVGVKLMEEVKAPSPDLPCYGALVLITFACFAAMLSSFQHLRNWVKRETKTTLSDVKI